MPFHSFFRCCLVCRRFQNVRFRLFTCKRKAGNFCCFYGVMLCYVMLCFFTLISLPETKARPHKHVKTLFQKGFGPPVCPFNRFSDVGSFLKPPFPSFACERKAKSYKSLSSCSVSKLSPQNRRCTFCCCLYSEAIFREQREQTMNFY